MVQSQVNAYVDLAAIFIAIQIQVLSGSKQVMDKAESNHWPQSMDYPIGPLQNRLHLENTSSN